MADVLRPRVRRAGLDLVGDPTAADAVVWTTPAPDGLADLVRAAERARWVQLPLAGIERFLPVVRSRDHGVVWTCAKSIYGPAVAEMTVALLIGAFRQLHRYARARTWEPLPGRLLAGAALTILGGGGIGRSLVRMLAPHDVVVTVVSRTGAPLEGARTVAADATIAAIAGSDAVVLALPLTDETIGMVDSAFLAAMRPTAWLVNVARGPVVVTDDLVVALQEGTVAGAALDVTDPEPLPDGHPLWNLDNAVVTPHVTNTPQLGMGAFADLVEANARRFAAGEPLAGVVDPVAGY